MILCRQKRFSLQRAEKAGRMGSCGGLISAYSTRENAGIAQLVEQLICNQQVVGSNPTAGSLINQGSATK